MLGREDPTLGLGEVNDRTVSGQSDYVWALRDINFNVNQGEVVGIIGRNGAGKSTLLKLLSRVTAPTSGSIKSKGRIASLLEVGTGFHPELTGRENIYLNGSIMGMTRREVASKLDEIVAFAGVERYLETPVKRYSSGMRVRLGFAVAAHLEPDILVVDEVLAVGDAEFQRKAIGKMKSVSTGEGRTVLFVSHNMSSVASLCSRGILLDNGQVAFDGEVNEAISNYISQGADQHIQNAINWKSGNEPQNEGVKLLAASVHPKGKDNSSPIQMDDDIVVNMLTQIENPKISSAVDVGFQLVDIYGKVIMTCSSSGVLQNQMDGLSGQFNFSCTVPGNLFNEGEFLINLFIALDRKRRIIKEDGVLRLLIGPKPKPLGVWMGKAEGILKPEIFKWDLQGTNNYSQHP